MNAYFLPTDADLPSFEEDFFGPDPEILDINRVGRARLERKASLLAAAGRLMNELIEKSVEADLAAEAKRAMIGDPAEGLRAE